VSFFQIDEAEHLSGAMSRLRFFACMQGGTHRRIALFLGQPKIPKKKKKKKVGLDVMYD
jgi:hypothetical protein